MSRASASARWQALKAILSEGHLLLMYAVVGLWAATDLAFFLAVSVVAYGDGGPGAVGLVGAARVLPGALCLGFVAVVADRVSRPLLVAGVNAAFVAISLAMAATVAAGRQPPGAGVCSRSRLRRLRPPPAEPPRAAAAARPPPRPS